MRIKLLAFDIDGTLFTSEAILERAYREGVADYNDTHPSKEPIAVPSVEAILAQIGNTAKNIFKQLFPSMPPDHYSLFSQLVRKRLIEDIRADKGALYEAVEATLSQLHSSGYHLRFASNGNRDYVEAIASHYKLNRFFGPLVAVDGEGIKDKGDILNTYKSAMNIQSWEMVMIGDRRADLLAARKAGCPFIGFTGGHGSNDEILEVDTIPFHRFPELFPILRVLEES